MKKKEDTTRKIPKKNYVILAVLFIFSIALVLYLCNLYQVYDEHQKETPIIRDTLSEIASDELDHYILENPTTVIYMCTAENMVCRNYEKDFKKLVEKENLQESIVYLNLSNLNQTEFVNNFNSKYPYKVSLSSEYPALVVFEDGKIGNVLQGTGDEKLTITKTKQFIDINNIGE